MTKKLNAIRGNFTKKVKLLEKAKHQLKKEFVGIDNIIDELIDNVRSWYTMNSVQEKPTVINLWGLTGVGKTSLVKRLMELIDFEDKTYRIDLGEKQGHMSFKNTINDLCENRDDHPIVIMLDEFQHTRTVSGPFRVETSFDESRKVWELIDSGVISYTSWRRGIFQFEELISKLKRLLVLGVTVENGVVTNGGKLFQSEIEAYRDEDEPIYFYPLGDYHLILELAGKELGFELHMDLQDELLLKNADETIIFLEKALRIAKKPLVKNFTRALIVVLGNVDEAYTMSGNYSADISADEFHRLSKKITVPEMKKALRDRFRDEQIARLGNIHIIYPAFNEQSYREIIALELEKVNQHLMDLSGIKLTYEKTVVDRIYAEGVYPTQGARPVFTTIHQLVKSKLSVYLLHIIEHKIKADNFHLCVAEDTLICSVRSRGVEKSVVSEKILSKLHKLRKPRRDERQAIAAVHESGHAVLNIVLLNKVPELVASITSDSESDGFMFSRNKRYYLRKDEVIPKAAMLLGGIAAEELIFGPNGITTGSSSDIATATSMVTTMLKKQGFGPSPILYSDSTTEESRFYHNNHDIEEQVRAMIEDALSLAKETLAKEKTMLLELANYLSEHSKIEKPKLIEFCKNYLTTPPILSIRKDHFRSTLKQAILEHRHKYPNTKDHVELSVVAKKRHDK